MRDFAEDNAQNNYILTVIDVLCKYAWMEALKTKIGVESASVFYKIFSEGMIPEKFNLMIVLSFIIKM